jgi:PAS domain S-box-containing protein
MEPDKAVVVDDVNASDIFKDTPSLAVLREAGVRAVISLPLVARTGRFVGMTNVHFANPQRPDVRVIQWLEVLGRQAADFIERKSIQHRLRESEARLQAAVHLVNLGLYAWNPQTNDLLWDDALREMWGLPAGSPVTYDIWLAGVHPEDRVRVGEAIRRSGDAKGDGIYDIEYRVIGTDGIERWIAMRGRTTFENNRPVSFYGVAQDVTDRKRTESQLESRVEARTRELLGLNRQLRSQIEQRKIAEAALDKLQQLDAIGQITSGVAHDFNNLLSVVLTNARLLSRKSMESDDQEGIELILAAAERGTKLTAQLLAFAGKQRLEPQIVDLNQKVADMRDLLAATLGDTVQLRALLHPQLWPALADPTQLEMVILNLAINGRDAMPSGGSVTIETFNAAIGDQPVRPEDPETGEYVGLAIRDTGTGIPEHVLARAFEPFFTTKRRGKGSGLGLAQVFGFARQTGGGMRIETRIGQGTCVKVFLPRADVDPKLPNRLESVASDQQSPFAGKMSVLVVDDDRAFLRTNIRMLQFLGYQGISAESGKEALDQLSTHPEIGLVLADFAMPEINGIELAGSIQAKYPGCPVILVTGCVDILEQCKDAIILQKPFTEDELRDKITAAFEAAISNS